MRIVHYYPRALSGDGGMTRAIRRLSNALHKAGADAVIAYDDGGQPPPEGPVSWVPVRHVGMTERFPVPSGLEQALRGADLVVLNSAWAPHNAMAGRCAAKLGIPYVLAPRGAYEQEIFDRRWAIKRPWWMAVEGPLVRRARGFHLFFDAERPIPQRLGFDGGVIVAPNGVEPPEDVVWDGGTGRYILWMGRFDPMHKGIDLLVRAVGQMAPDDRPSVRLHGPDTRGGRGRMRDLVSELGLERWITVADAIYGGKKWDVLSRATGFIYPSRWEGFGNSVAEAASIGVPTVVTPYYLGRFLSERDAAIMVEPSAAGIAGGLQALAGSRAAETGWRARQVARSELAWDAIGRSWLAQAEALL